MEDQIRFARLISTRGFYPGNARLYEPLLGKVVLVIVEEGVNFCNVCLHGIERTWGNEGEHYELLHD